MEIFSCKNCGAKNLLREKDAWVCPYCDARFVVPLHSAGGSRDNFSSSIDLEDDVARLLAKCKSDPKNARKYANLVLDIDPDNPEALMYLRR